MVDVLVRFEDSDELEVMLGGGFVVCLNGDCGGELTVVGVVGFAVKCTSDINESLFVV